MKRKLYDFVCYFALGIAGVVATDGCSGCQPIPVPAPVPAPPVPVPVIYADAAPPKPISDVYQDACNAIAIVGCREGADSSCASRMRAADTDGLTTVPVACLSNVRSVADVRSCGFVECK